MDQNTELTKHLQALHRKVHFLTGIVLVLSVLLVLMWVKSPATDAGDSDTITAKTIEADQIRTSGIIIRGADPDSAAIHLASGKAGPHLFFRDAGDHNLVSLTPNGFSLADAGGHALYLGLNPGPGDKHTPFVEFRDSEQKSRLGLGLHAENEEPYVKLQGKNPERVLELSPEE